MDFDPGHELGNGHFFVWMLAPGGRYDVPDQWRNWQEPGGTVFYGPEVYDGDQFDLIGIMERHWRPGLPQEPENLHGGGVYFAPNVFRGNAVWTVESLDPLTISPSVLCGCGSHGFIKEGRWIPA